MAEIVTARLTLRAPRPEDLDAVHALVSDFEVARQTASWPHPGDRAFTATRLEPLDPAQGLRGPVLRDGEIIGLMGLVDGSLGYMFACAHWGQGYATEIGAGLIAHCFARYDWPHVEAGVFDGNPASARVLEKLGFRWLRDGEYRCAAEGRLRPLTEYRLTRADWASHG